MVKIVKRLGFLAVLAVVVVGVFMGMTRMHILMFGNSRYYQRTKPYSTSEGLVNQKIYHKNTLRRLTVLTHGTQYTGNTGLDEVATHYKYHQAGKNISNFMGSDGVLQLYNESKMMTTPMVRDAASFWNQVAGHRVVEVVKTARASDEVIHDGKTQAKYIGGQHYDGTGMEFFPANWVSKGFTATEDLDNREAVLIREMGHALGIPNLGGGKVGGNAAAKGYITTEVMGVWETGPNVLPANRRGIRSSRMDAAAIALAGISWQRPRKLGGSMLTGQKAVLYHDGRVTTVKSKN